MTVKCDKADTCIDAGCPHHRPHSRIGGCDYPYCGETGEKVTCILCPPLYEWNEIEDGDPGSKGSDRRYMVVLHNKFITVSFFFEDSYGSWWSDQWDIYDKLYSDGQVTHWAEMPSLPEQKEMQS